MSIQFIHLRDKSSCKGGITVAFEYDDESKVVSKAAIARCHEKDNYNKKIGRIKAAGRLNSPRLCVYSDGVKTKQDFINDCVRGFKDGVLPVSPFYGYPPKD